MANYLYKKFKGKYRVLAHIDQETNDFPRDEQGNIDSSFDDFYITCSYGNQIYHYGQNILVAYIPSRQRGNNILRKLNEEYSGVKVFDIEATDSELLFKFKANDIEPIAELLKARTSGANISPLSVKNLPKPKEKYIIPTEDLSLYKEITSKVDKGDLLNISRVTKRFLSEQVPKRYKGIDVSKDMKMCKMFRLSKEYIHKKDMWKDYIKYLERELN